MVVSLKYLKSAGKCHGILPSFPIPYSLSQATIIDIIFAVYHGSSEVTVSRNLPITINLSLRYDTLKSLFDSLNKAI